MRKENEVLKAEFQLDMTSLNRQLAVASDRMAQAMARANAQIARAAAGNTAAWGASGAKIGDAMGRNIAHGVTRALSGLAGSVSRTLGRITSMPLRAITSPMGMIAGGVSAVGAVAGMRGVINAGRDLQSQQVEIQKTTNLSDVAINALTQRLIEFSNATGVSRAALMALAADAGRLGVRTTEELEKFATTFAKAQTATNITTDMAEEVMRVMNTINEPVKNIDRLMSAVNELGNNLATNERRILEFMGAMPGLSTLLGLNTTQLLGFAAAASTTSNEAGLMATAMNNLATAMLEGISKGGKQLAVFASTANMTEDEWRKLFARDKNEAVLRFIEGIKRTSDAGGDLVRIFDDMGSEGARLVRAILSLSNITETLRGAQASAAEATQQNVSINKEFGRRLNTVAQQQNRVTETLRNFIATINNNELNTRIFTTLADVLHGMITEHQVELAARLQSVMEKIADAVVSLPYALEKARVVFKALVTDPEYFTGVITAIGQAMGDALAAAWTSFIALVGATVDLIVQPLVDAILQSIAVATAQIPVIGTAAVGRAAAGYTGPQLKKAMGVDAMPASREAAKQQGGMAQAYFEAARNYANDQMRKHEYDPGVDPYEVQRQYREEFAAKFTPELFSKYMLPALGGDQRKELMDDIAKLRESPEVRADRAAELSKVAGERTQTALEELNKSLDGAADRVRQAGGKLADAIAGKGTQYEKELAQIEERRQAAQGDMRKQLAAKRAAYNPLAPVIEQFNAQFDAVQGYAKLHPFRTALEKPVMDAYEASRAKMDEEQRKQVKPWQEMDTQQRQAAINAHYAKNVYGRDVAEMLGFRGGAQYYNRDIVNERMRKALSYEERNYTDQRARMLNQYIMDDTMRGAVKGKVGSAGDAAPPINVIISPAETRVDLQGNGDIRATIKWAKVVQNANTAAALVGMA